jgi:hypothetical protein
MPAESEAQRKFLYATKGEAWVKEHHFDNKGKLPAKVKGAGSGPGPKKQAKANMDKIAKGLRA